MAAFAKGAKKGALVLYFALCVLVFVSAYTLNLLYVTVFYHRALAHRSVELCGWLERFVFYTGNWVTGLDPKAWVCMHRLHHVHSDTKRDPHSPISHGIWKVLPAQLKSYKKTIAGLIFQRSYYASMVGDILPPIHWLNRRQLWYLPYVLHAAVAVGLASIFHAWVLSACYWFGMMSHPIQGWLVNALAHRFGYRNFETQDNSRNNSVVAWLVFGEGYQNNHHHRPQSAKFSVKRGEIDLGFTLCQFLASLKLLKFSG